MKVSYDTRTGTTTVKMTLPEVRQFLGHQSAVEVVRHQIHHAIALTEFNQQKEEVRI